jgi:predicted nucleotidyltransferase
MSQKKYESSLLFKRSLYYVAEQVFKHPSKTFHIRMLQKETGLSTTAVIAAVKELEKCGIVKIEKTTLTTNIKADIESDVYREHKRIFNMYLLERYHFTQQVKESYNPSAIVLFGSFSRGEDIEKSDVDVLIITKNKPLAPQAMQAYFTGLERSINRVINLHALKDLDGSSTEFRNNVANGIVLYGYLKVV